MLTTQQAIRRQFWDDFPEFKEVKGRRQNDYSVDVRVCFVDYVDMLARDGTITEALAQRVTL